jgi:aryl-alcohol dehydrogenase-like predicted oxidoreductase
LERFVSAQNYYNLLNRRAERDLLPVCDSYGIGFLPYFPLENGLLTGKYRRGQPPPDGTRLAGNPIADDTYDKLSALESFAKERGHSLLELAFAGLLSRPVVSSVIAGATSAEQVRANVRAAEWQLTGDDLESFREL